MKSTRPGWIAMCGGKTMRQGTILLMVIMAVALEVTETLGCTCPAPLPSPKVALERADAVFIGTVTEIKPSPLRRYLLDVCVEVDRVWKGAVDPRMIVNTPNNEGSCGYTFTEGKSYLIYAGNTELPEGLQLSTGLCSRTRLLENAAEDLAELGLGKDVAALDKELEPLLGPIAHWAFEEGRGSTVYDWAGNNDGIVHGAKWTTGRVGRALSFDGSGDYVEVADDDSLSPGSVVTLEAWIRPASIPTDGETVRMMVAGKWNDAPTEAEYAEYEIQIWDGKVCFYAYGADTGYKWAESLTTLVAGNWYHVSGVFDGSTLQVYINGSLDGPSTAFAPAAGIPNNKGRFTIGAQYWDYNNDGVMDQARQFHGIIDEVAIYNRALSAEEIQQLYKHGSPDQVKQSPRKPAGPSVSLVTMTPLGVMFEFRPPTGSSGWTDMELYEHGGEMLAEFSCPHIGEPIQVWLAEPVDQNDPAKYYLRYRIRVTAAPLPKWRVIGLSRMPRTTNKTSHKNASSTTMSAKEMNVKLPMSHGPMKDGLAAFLICGQNQFKVGEPITVMLGVAYLRQSKVQMPVWSPSRAKDGLTSWFSIKDPDGKEISYESGRGNYYIPDPNKYMMWLRVRQFAGRYEYLKKYHDFNKPGIYTIKWHYRAHPSDFWWQGELVSNEIQIEILPVDNSELEALRKTLLETDPRGPYGLWLPADEPGLKAIEQLRSAASPEAVAILQEFLTTHHRNHKLKREALIALGRIGTGPAIESVRQFEAWAKKRFTEPPPFRFGSKDHAIDHFTPHHLSPLAKTTDEKNKTWAIFQWKRHSGVAETWICKSLGEDLWSQPILLNFPGMPEFNVPQIGTKWDEKCSFQIKNGSIKITVGDKIWQSRISDHLVDSDKDGLPDPVEARLLTDLGNPDSDKDGQPDGKDCNPLTPKHNDINDVTEIRQAVFSALCATGNSQDAVVIVDRGDFARQEYYGYGGYVLRSPEIRTGFINIVAIMVKIESPITATATIADYEGPLAASGHEAKLKKINGKWVVVEFKMTWIS